MGNTTKYRIITKTFGNGETRWYAQKKQAFKWEYLDNEGNADSFKYWTWSRENALEHIDRNYTKYYESAKRIVSIEIEYIERP